MEQYRTVTKRINICIFLIVICSFTTDCTKNVSLKRYPPIHISDSGTDRATAYQMQNKIVTSSVGGVTNTHFVYAKNSGGDEFIHWKTMTAWVATYNHHTNRIESDTFLGYIYDNHGSPALTIDKDGYLHVVYGPHHHPVCYRKSLRPNDSTRWSEEERISAIHGVLHADDDYGTGKNITGEMTYPVIKVDSQGTVHVVSSRSNAVCYVCKKNGKWGVPRTIYESTKRFSRYDVMMNIDTDDSIHILAPDLELESNGDTLYRGNLDYYYFVSHDGGNTFSRKEHVWSSEDGYGQGGGSIAFDESGHPHFLVIERNFNISKNIWHVYCDGKRWRKKILGIPGKHIWQSKLTIDNRGNVYIFFQASDSMSDWRDSSNALYLAYSAGKKYDENFNIWTMQEPAERKNPWLPTIQEHERYGEFDSEGFFVMWIDDEPGNPNILESLVQTNVYAEKIGIVME